MAGQDRADGEEEDVRGEEGVEGDDRPRGEVEMEGQNAERVELGALGDDRGVEEEGAGNGKAVLKIADGVGIEEGVAVEERGPGEEERGDEDGEAGLDPFCELHGQAWHMLPRLKFLLPVCLALLYCADSR